MGAAQRVEDTDPLSGVELRHLRYFAAVAESGTVTAAAERLHIAQPSLSQQIRLLERRVGTPLFERGSTGMELTEGGELLLQGVNKCLAELRASVAAARGARPTVTLGVCRGVPQPVLSRAEELVTRARGARVVCRQIDSERQTAALRAGTLACGLLRTPADTTGLSLRVLSDEPLGAVMHSGHPLASRSRLTWPELAGQRLLWFPAARAPGYAAAVLASLRAHGWHPETLAQDDGGHTLFRHRLLGRDDLIALRPHSGVFPDPDLLWRPLGPEPPHEQLALAVPAAQGK
ncbi:LysR family transcriptional regulator [Streptomyces diacarni]|uniref:LysR family transcriptional regulator n=1 Tax=Streptomyces diacarni TaxID=2800381 RepID=A0A367EXN2_9ACTN|nr:LysR family transcriptional regulator [Streptomyces diacarni]RCG22888.1 LysR family transcriptional regulator [Streptomyces diacarni]